MDEHMCYTYMNFWPTMNFGFLHIKIIFYFTGSPIIDVGQIYLVGSYLIINTYNKKNPDFEKGVKIVFVVIWCGLYCKFCLTFNVVTRAGTICHRDTRR